MPVGELLRRSAQTRALEVDEDGAVALGEDAVREGDDRGCFARARAAWDEDMLGEFADFEVERSGGRGVEAKRDPNGHDRAVPRWARSLPVTLQGLLAAKHGSIPRPFLTVDRLSPQGQSELKDHEQGRTHEGFHGNRVGHVLWGQPSGQRRLPWTQKRPPGPSNRHGGAQDCHRRHPQSSEQPLSHGVGPGHSPDGPCQDRAQQGPREGCGDCGRNHEERRRIGVIDVVDLRRPRHVTRRHQRYRRTMAMLRQPAQGDRPNMYSVCAR